MGVPSGPFKARRFLVIESVVRARSGALSVSTADSPAGTSSHLTLGPAASTARKAASAISGPMPSPRMRDAVRISSLMRAYVPWPSDVDPVLFELVVDRGARDAEEARGARRRAL